MAAKIFDVFREIFLEFRKTRDQNLDEIFAISRSTEPKLGTLFCYFGRINSLN